MSLSGTILWAQRGTTEAREYSLRAPPPNMRQNWQAAALLWWMDRNDVPAVLSMLDAGFGATLLVPYMHRKHFNEFFNRVYRGSPLTLLSKRLAITILREYRATQA